MLEYMKHTLSRVPDLDVQTDVPMSAHTSFGIGGPADMLVTPRTIDALAQVMRVTHEAGVRPLIIGNGTNMLVLDAGVRGVVVKLADGLNHIEARQDGLTVDGGVGLASLCSACAENGFGDMEWAAGIPGTAGGALTMNAGANGGEIGQFAQWVTIVTLQGERRTLQRDEMTFGYRTSSFQRMDCVIARAALRLPKADPAQIREKMCAVLEARCSKHPVAMPSAGCVFKRPLNDYAGRLLEEVGAKGMRIGGAIVSSKHANFIVNDGGATAEDVLQLIEIVRDRVREMFDVDLTTEICIVGEPSPSRPQESPTTVASHVHATR